MSAHRKSRAARPASPDPVTVQLHPRRILIWVSSICLGLIIFLWLADFFINYSHWTEVDPLRRLFNATREDGLTGYAMLAVTMLTVLAAWAMFVIARRKNAGRFTVIGWFILAALLTYMGIDDGAMIHERVGSTFKGLSATSNGEPGVGGKLLEAFPSYPWQVIFIPIFAPMGLFVLIFLWKELGDRAGRLLVIAALASFAISVGFDFFEGMDEDEEWNIYSSIAQNESLDRFTRQQFQKRSFVALRHFSKTTEECLEMFGMTLLLIAFLRHAMREAPIIHITSHTET